MCRLLRLLVTLSIVVLIVPAARAQWVKLTESYSGANYRLVSIGPILFAAGGGGAYLSRDSGANWARVDSLPVGSVISVALRGGTLLVGTTNGTVLCSTDSGTSWKAVPGSLPNRTSVYALVASGLNVLASTENGVYISTNDGTSWSSVSIGSNGLRVTSFAASGKNLFAGSQNGGVFISEDDGLTWSTANAGLRDIEAVSVGGGTLFAASYGGGVLSSSDDGSNWSASNSGLEDFHVNAVAATDSILLAGTIVGIYLSKDNGRSWTTTGIGRNVVDYALTISGSFVYAGTDSYVYRRSVSELVSDHSILRIQPQVGDSLWFGNVRVDAGSTRTVTVSDTGSMPVTIGSFQLTGDRTDFVTSDLSSSVTLQPGESYTFEVLFQPSTSGYHTATLILLSEGHSINLKLGGVGVDASGVKDNDAKRTICIYPNPTASSSTISFTPEVAGHVEISIVNLLGVEVARVFSGELDASEHTFTWRADKMQPATYECLVRMSNKLQSTPIVVE
jgi:photosystem II stability/assembly factor-like uncharacterized protein